MKTTTCLLCCIAICFIGTVSINGQNTDVDLGGKRVTIRVEKVHLGTVLGYLREVHDVPIGFEESTLDRKNTESRFSANSPGISYYSVVDDDGVLKIAPNTRSESPSLPITLNAENEHLRDVLKKIFEQVDNYNWEIIDGVVNVYPSIGRDERFRRLLGLKINRFVFEKGNPIWVISENIKALPEFKEFLSQNNLQFNAVRSGPEDALKAMYGRQINENMNFSNLTFRELLNEIIRIKRGGWILKWRFLSTKTGEEFIDIDI